MSAGVRRAAFFGAFTALLIALLPPVDDFALRSLVGHMIQHLIHTDVVAPLLVIAAPAMVRPLRRIPAMLSLLLSVGGIFAIHFSPLFEASLISMPIHLLVNALFVAFGILMWAPVFDPGRLPHLMRLAYVFVAIPITGLLGFALHVARFPLYPHYVAICGAGALADQQNGADVMWIGGCLLMFLAFMVVMLEFAQEEQRRLQS